MTIGYEAGHECSGPDTIGAKLWAKAGPEDPGHHRVLVSGCLESEDVANSTDRTESRIALLSEAKYLGPRRKTRLLTA